MKTPNLSFEQFAIDAMYCCMMFNNYNKLRFPHHVVIDRCSSTCILNEDIIYKARKMKLRDSQAVCFLNSLRHKIKRKHLVQWPLVQIRSLLSSRGPTQTQKRLL